jgi:hypothetical protein
MLVVGAAACGSTDIDETQFIAPLDGQTAVPASLALTVRAPFSIPPDYPTDDMIRVLDLTDGVEVVGTTSPETGVVTFSPDADWAPGHRFAWTVDPKLGAPHGPEVLLPADVVGTAVFSTAPALHILGAALEDDALCLVFSRTVQPEGLPEIRVTIDDADIALDPAQLDIRSHSEWIDLPELDETDTGVDVACLPSPPTVQQDSSVRIWVGDDNPWFYELQDVGVYEVLGTLRRASP